MLTNFMLLSGNDIPFPGAKINIRQPRLKDIALLGEEIFFLGCGMLNFSKDLLNISDKSDLDNYTDFDILLTLLNSPAKEDSLKSGVAAAKSVLTLLFSDREIVFDKTGIILKKSNKDFTYINHLNFLEFKEILIKMFNLNNMSGLKEYNPEGASAQRIVDKLKERHRQLAKRMGGKESDIFGRYVSILAVGEGKDMNELFQYTVYQLYDEIARFNAKREYDTIFKAKLAGAQKLDEVQDWTLDINELNKNKNK